LRSSIVLFIIVDPVGNVPILIELTRDLSAERRRRAYDSAVIVGSGLLLLFALAGHQILVLFDVSIYSFKIAGGILFLFIALQILLYGGEKLPLKTRDVGVFPIGFPILVGPGAITTTIITISSSGQLIAILTVLVVMFLTWLTLRIIDSLYTVLGREGADVVARIMAVILAAIAVEYIVSGVREAAAI